MCLRSNPPLLYDTAYAVYGCNMNMLLKLGYMRYTAMRGQRKPRWIERARAHLRSSYRRRTKACSETAEVTGERVRNRDPNREKSVECSAERCRRPPRPGAGLLYWNSLSGSRTMCSLDGDFGADAVRVGDRSKRRSVASVRVVTGQKVTLSLRVGVVSSAGVRRVTMQVGAGREGIVGRG